MNNRLTSLYEIKHNNYIFLNTTAMVMMQAFCSSSWGELKYEPNTEHCNAMAQPQAHSCHQENN